MSDILQFLRKGLKGLGLELIILCLEFSSVILKDNGFRSERMRIYTFETSTERGPSLREEVVVHDCVAIAS